MSEETVTIEIPVRLLKACEHGRVTNNLDEIHKLFGDAREKVKTELEKWREGLWLSYGSPYIECSLEKCLVRPGPHDAKLMAAAPTLLDALLWVVKTHGTTVCWPAISEAIKAALPEAVWQEVFNEE